MKQSANNLYGMLVEILLVIAWLGLPFTSFPILGWLSNSQAAPLSAIPIGLILVIWLVPQLIRGRQLPLEVVPLLGFVLIAVASSAAVLFSEVIPYEGRPLWGQSSRALFTLLIGVSFYVVIAGFIQNERVYIKALRWIHIGGALMLLWGAVQIIVITTTGGDFPPTLDRIRTWLVIQPHGVQIGNRLSGLSYEPSWFAHQLNLLYLPLWLAATYLRQSVFRLRILKLSIENILLMFGLLEFVLSRPRVGFAALLLVIGYIFVKIIIASANVFSTYLTGRIKSPAKNKKSTSTILSLLVAFGFISLFIGIVFSIAFIGSKLDERLALLFQPIPEDELMILTAFNENTLLYIGARLQFLERTIYWLLGWHIFNDFPLFGVGLGNTGFFVYSHISPTAWMTLEFRDLAYRLGYMINTKSYWLRILAETGIVGFSFFTAWIVGLWRSTLHLLRCHRKTLMLIGLAGQFSILAFVFEGFSLDSFALPYLWVAAGLISAARMIADNEIPQDDELPRGKV
jgi:hypothetical protein